MGANIAQLRSAAEQHDAAGGPAGHAPCRDGSPHFTLKAGAQGARPSRPAADRGREAGAS